MWKEENNRLQRSFVFPDFVSAFAFLTKVAFLAEKHAHHPAIYNVYNRVELSLCTHEAGNTVTDKDRCLSQAIDALL